ncbi:hypothetical protein [Celeribacter sp.]|uniref:hypothetical protein n=1 Tax=Celeribacter sp. TaxID=1890673 RepID=UPI003A93BD10
MPIQFIPGLGATTGAQPSQSEDMAPTKGDAQAGAGALSSSSPLEEMRALFESALLNNGNRAGQDGAAGGAGAEWGTSDLFSDPNDFDLNGSFGRLEAAAEKLTQAGMDPLEVLNELLGELGAAEDLAALMIEFASMGRQNALDQRLSARDQARADLEGQAQTMREAAVTQLVVSVVSTAAAVGASVVSFKGAGQAGKLAGAAKDASMEGASEMSTALNTQAQNVSTRAQAVSGLINAGSSAGEGGGSMISKNIEAGGQELAAKAQTEQSNAELGKSVMDDFKDLVRSIIQFLKDQQQAEIDRMATTTRI